MSSKRKGQIGIKVTSQPRCIGFYDLSRRLLCLRRNANAGPGLYFNMADNDQPNGPCSAADSYSIFNSDPDMAAFELETVGSAIVLGKWPTGSRLVAETTFAVFPNEAGLVHWLNQHLGD
ncbi:MAG: hypothetical protein ACUVWR_03630 [Anaerolineae bacterium]